MITTNFFLILVSQHYVLYYFPVCPRQNIFYVWPLFWGEKRHNLASTPTLHKQKCTSHACFWLHGGGGVGIIGCFSRARVTVTFAMTLAKRVYILFLQLFQFVQLLARSFTTLTCCWWWAMAYYAENVKVGSDEGNEKANIKKQKLYVCVAIQNLDLSQQRLTDNFTEAKFLCTSWIEIQQRKKTCQREWMVKGLIHVRNRSLSCFIVWAVT